MFPCDDFACFQLSSHTFSSLDSFSLRLFDAIHLTPLPCFYSRSDPLLDPNHPTLLKAKSLARKASHVASEVRTKHTLSRAWD